MIEIANASERNNFESHQEAANTSAFLGTPPKVSGSCMHWFQYYANFISWIKSVIEWTLMKPKIPHTTK